MVVAAAAKNAHAKTNTDTVKSQSQEAYDQSSVTRPSTRSHRKWNVDASMGPDVELDLRKENFDPGRALLVFATPPIALTRSAASDAIPTAARIGAKASHRSVFFDSCLVQNRTKATLTSRSARDTRTAHRIGAWYCDNSDETAYSKPRQISRIALPTALNKPWRNNVSLSALNVSLARDANGSGLPGDAPVSPPRRERSQPPRGEVGADEFRFRVSFFTASSACSAVSSPAPPRRETGPA